MDEATFVASIDSSMDMVNSSTNYGTFTRLGVGVVISGGSKLVLRRAIGNFNVSSIANATINSAKLVHLVDTTFAGAATGKVSRCARPATWKEHEVTWDRYRTADPGTWTAGGGDSDIVTPPGVNFTLPEANGGWEIIGMAGHVTDAISNRSNIVSVILYMDNENPSASNFLQFASREYVTEADRWRLVVAYTLAESAGREAHEQIQSV